MWFVVTCECEVNVFGGFWAESIDHSGEKSALKVKVGLWNDAVCGQYDLTVR